MATSAVPLLELEWQTARGLPCSSGRPTAATAAKKQSRSRWMMARSGGGPAGAAERATRVQEGVQEKGGSWSAYGTSQGGNLLGKKWVRGGRGSGELQTASA